MSKKVFFGAAILLVLACTFLATGMLLFRQYLPDLTALVAPPSPSSTPTRQVSSPTPDQDLATFSIRALGPTQNYANAFSDLMLQLNLAVDSYSPSMLLNPVWRQRVFDNLDSMLISSEEMANVPVPPELQATGEYLDEIYAETVALSTHLKAGLNALDPVSITAAGEHLQTIQADFTLISKDILYNAVAP